MVILDLETSVHDYLHERHVHASTEWIRSVLPADIRSADASNGRYEEQIYRRWLECNWNDPSVFISLNSTPSMPAALDFSNVNGERMTYTGKYLCQINQIIDISKPLCYELEQEVDDVIASDGEDSDQENNFGKLFKRSTGKKGASQASQKTKEAGGYQPQFGSRMLQLSLYDGHHECIGIEYSPIPALHANLLGAKVLLTGPFDVYIGTALLRPENIQIVSTVTFDLNAVPVPLPLSGSAPDGTSAQEQPRASVDYAALVESLPQLNHSNLTSQSDDPSMIEIMQDLANANEDLVDELDVTMDY